MDYSDYLTEPVDDEETDRRFDWVDIEEELEKIDATRDSELELLREQLESVVEEIEDRENRYETRLQELEDEIDRYLSALKSTYGPGSNGDERRHDIRSALRELKSERRRLPDKFWDDLQPLKREVRELEKEINQLLEAEELSDLLEDL